MIDTILWETMLPDCYNDGSTINRLTINKLLEDVARHFGGYTLSGPCRGCYVNRETGMTQVESVRRLIVACPRRQLEDARYMAENIGRELRQNVVYFSWWPSNVELIKTGWTEPRTER